MDDLLSSIGFALPAEGLADDGVYIPVKVPLHGTQTRTIRIVQDAPRVASVPVAVLLDDLLVVACLARRDGGIPECEEQNPANEHDDCESSCSEYVFHRGLLLLEELQVDDVGQKESDHRPEDDANDVECGVP